MESIMEQFTYKDKYGLFTKEEIELINEVCGEWTEFVFQQGLDVMFSILECIKEQIEEQRGIEVWNNTHTNTDSERL